MPIPFIDLGDAEPAGVAGYLRFIDEPDGKGIRGALFIMSTRGEPIEFAFTRIDCPTGSLWGPGVVRSRAVAQLAKALFPAVNQQADVLLTPAQETPPEVFSEEIRLEIPLCRVADGDSAPPAPLEQVQRLPESATLYWVNGSPPPDSQPGQTLGMLQKRRLLLEPFARAALGIEEALAS